MEIVIKILEWKGFKRVAALDPDLDMIVSAFGLPLSRSRPEGFASLLNIIVEQQVSVAAANTIWRRLETKLGEVSPDTVLASDGESLNGVGLSRRKINYALSLANAIKEGRLSLDSLSELSDESAICALTVVKGIGRWTAEIYLMSALMRPDIWPATDLVLKTALAKLKALPRQPRFSEMTKVSEAWRPWRTFAARLLWHYYRHYRVLK